MKNFSNDTYSKIDTYVSGTMTEAECIAFEEELHTRPGLAEEVEINRQMQLQYDDTSWSFAGKDSNNVTVRALETYLKSEEAQALSTKIREAEEHYEEQTARVRRRRFFYYAAASVAALFLAGNFFINSNGGNLYDDYKNWENIPSVTVRSNTSNLVSEGEALFKQQKYADAIIILNAYLEENPDLLHPQALAYLGASYAETDQYENAIHTFNQLQNSDALDSENAYWYKALTYVKQGDEEKAKTQLEAILSHPDHPYYKEAETLMEEL